MSQRVFVLLVVLMLVCLISFAQNKKSAVLENDGDDGIGAVNAAGWYCASRTSQIQ
jgi:hypothetical protein